MSASSVARSLQTKSPVTFSDKPARGSLCPLLRRASGVVPARRSAGGWIRSCYTIPYGCSPSKPTLHSFRGLLLCAAGSARGVFPSPPTTSSGLEIRNGKGAVAGPLICDRGASERASSKRDPGTLIRSLEIASFPRLTTCCFESVRYKTKHREEPQKKKTTSLHSNGFHIPTPFRLSGLTT